MVAVGADGPVDLIAAPLEPEIARAVLDLETPGDGQATGLAEFEVCIREDLAFAEVRGDLQPDVVLRVLPEEDAGSVISVVLRRRGFPARVAGPRGPHADLEFARDVMKDARRVHNA